MKEMLVDKLVQQRDELLRVCDTWAETSITTIPLVGAWTIKDVVGHIAYWEQVIHEHLRESLTEGKPHPMSPAEDNETINAREAAKRQAWTWQRVRTEFVDTRNGLIAHVANLREEDLAFTVPNPWWGMTHLYSLAQMIEEDALSHAAEHLGQLRRAEIK